VDFTCNEKARTGSSTRCIFHDENYVKDHYEEFEHEATKRFEEKVRESISENKPLECVGYYLPAIEFAKYFSNEANFHGATFSGKADFNSVTFSGKANFHGATFSNGANFHGATFSNGADFNRVAFSDEANFNRVTFSNGAIAIFNRVTFSGKADFNSVTFSGKANFNRVTFSGKADFHGATFSNGARFSEATFFKEADFIYATFSDSVNFSQVKFLNEVRFSNPSESKVFDNETLFQYVIFEQPYKAMFDINDLSKVSFAGSDISKITFTDKVRWGGDDGLKVIEEKWLEDQSRSISLDLVLYVYRRLRENYEFKLKFDEAGKFFIKEMELKRSYRTVRSKNKGASSSNGLEVRKNDPLRRHFSLTALYYRFSTYGESILKPTLIGIITIGLSTLFWLMQSDPTLHPSFSENNPSSSNISNFIWLSKFNDTNHLLKSFERSFADFLPLLPMGSEIKVGIIDYIIKIVGGALTFGLLAIALRRKFERKYTR
jgi:uncharacterized protein YjbI with pentapeptide repeats